MRFNKQNGDSNKSEKAEYIYETYIETNMPLLMIVQILL